MEFKEKEIQTKKYLKVSDMKRLEKGVIIRSTKNNKLGEITRRGVWLEHSRKLIEWGYIADYDFYQIIYHTIKVYN